VLGLCLKRYSMLPSGRAMRLNTHVDIPIEIALPHFIKDDKMDDSAPIYGNFKLSLQSVICHRGVSVNSGHYISLVRGTAANAEASTGSEKRSKFTHGPWMRFDDLAKERITIVDIEEAIKKESPYLLFYQIVPIDGDPGHITDGERPPSYTESIGVDSGVGGLSMTSLPSDAAPTSGRPSFEITDFEEPRGRSSFSADRRPSVAFTDSSLQSAEGALKPESISSAILGATLKQGGASPAPSRRSSIFRKNSSNPGSRSQSQTGEGRLGSGFSISKMAAKLSREKLDKIDSEGTELAGDTGTVVLVSPLPAPAPAPASTAMPPPTTTTEKRITAPSNMASAVAGVVAANRLSENAAGKQAKRDKSKNRLSKHHVQGQDGKGKPDRECVVM
jgi:hypothetical protein